MIARLVDATIDTIVAEGYYRTSISAVCNRAEVTPGALFRHFDNRLALIARTAHEVSQRLLAAYAAAAQHVRGQPSALRTALALLANTAQSPLVAVWHEMMIAARTDEQLRTSIGPAVEQLYAGIYTQANDMGLLDAVPDSSRELALFSIVSMFSGAALTGSVYPRPDLDSYRIPLAEYYATHTPQLHELDPGTFTQPIT
ncbi:TetR family transcriptional regulator [Nocardia brasiliensis ATCC 700358]|uniref:TetR family transcriptional regulator n=2 Tax=Nocardia brasiliensis TaxID=37326 RepID=K0ETP8_NOCB7|nr:TetR family transcriptional regulator [Nocardia brasiliensis ATCC 700358]